MTSSPGVPTDPTPPEPSPADAEARTLAYYAAGAAAYAASTAALDLRAQYAPFLARVPAGGVIYDGGCGSGRDAAAFAALGYQVVAAEPVDALARVAEARLGQPVRRTRHQDVTDVEAFDGVWLLATLLHVPSEELAPVLARYARALRPGGVLFASFKVGAVDGPDAQGRWFTNMTPDRLAALLAAVPTLQALAIAENPDGVRPDTRWITVLAERRATPAPAVR